MVDAHGVGAAEHLPKLQPLLSDCRIVVFGSDLLSQEIV
jgi:hypothetical protein